MFAPHMERNQNFAPKSTEILLLRDVLRIRAA